MKTLILLLASALTMAAQNDWSALYAYQKKSGGIEITYASDGSFSIALPQYGSKYSPSKPYLTGEWMGYLYHFQPTPLIEGKSIIIDGQVIETGTPIYRYDSETYNTAAQDATTLANFRANLAGGLNGGLTVGMTFGGGCAFGHGVNVQGGTATIKIINFSVNQ